MEKNKRNKGLAEIADVFLVSAYNNIESVKEIQLKNKKKYFMARAVLESAQRNLAYVIRLHKKMGE